MAVNSEAAAAVRTEGGANFAHAVRKRIRELLIETAEMPPTARAARIGWTGSSRWFGDNLLRLRPEPRRIDSADQLTSGPGDKARCDLWYSPETIPLEDATAKLLPGPGITAGHSWSMVALMIRARKTEDLLLGRGS